MNVGATGCAMYAHQLDGLDVSPVMYGLEVAGRESGIVMISPPGG